MCLTYSMSSVLASHVVQKRSNNQPLFEKKLKKHGRCVMYLFLLWSGWIKVAIIAVCVINVLLVDFSSLPSSPLAEAPLSDSMVQLSSTSRSYNYNPCIVAHF
jgi:hypothetical protein